MKLRVGYWEHIANFVSSMLLASPKCMKLRLSMILRHVFSQPVWISASLTTAWDGCCLCTPAVSTLSPFPSKPLSAPCRWIGWQFYVEASQALLNLTDMCSFSSACLVLVTFLHIIFQTVVTPARRCRPRRPCWSSLPGLVLSFYMS